MDEFEHQTIGRSVEPSRLTYRLRRAAVVAGLGVIAAVAALGATGMLSSALPGVLGGDESADVSTETITEPDSPTAGGAEERSVVVEPSIPDVPSMPEAVAMLPGRATDSAELQIQVGAVPDRSSRLVAQAPQRVLDTRSGEAPPSPTTTHEVTVVDDRTAVALSVTIMEAEREGSVLIDGRAGAVEAIAIGAPGVTTTNLVIVPLVGNQLTIRSSAGGHLVVDVVGTFEASTGSASGRFVTTDGLRLTTLQTEVDGREAEIDLSSEIPADAEALLVAVNADVGADGGAVRLGAPGGDFNQMLMWAPAADQNNRRRGLAIIEPTTEGISRLRYDGGSVLTLDVVGYFTGESSELDTDGLYVPTGPRKLFSGLLSPDGAIEVDEIEADATIAVIAVGSTSAIAGQLGSFLLPLNDGTASLTSTSDLEAKVTLLGVFL